MTAGGNYQGDVEEGNGRADMYFLRQTSLWGYFTAINNRGQ